MLGRATGSSSSLVRISCRQFAKEPKDLTLFHLGSLDDVLPMATPDEKKKTRPPLRYSFESLFLDESSDATGEIVVSFLIS
jgi:hypothetical protein